MLRTTAAATGMPPTHALAMLAMPCATSSWSVRTRGPPVRASMPAAQRSESREASSASATASGMSVESRCASNAGEAGGGHERLEGRERGGGHAEEHGDHADAHRDERRRDALVQLRDEEERPDRRGADRERAEPGGDQGRRVAHLRDDAHAGEPEQAGELRVEDEQADGGHEPADDGRGHRLDEAADAQHAEGDLDQAGEEGGREQAREAVLGHDRERQRRERDLGSRHLQARSAEERGQDAGHRAGHQADRGGQAAREGQGHVEGERHHRCGDAGEDVVAGGAPVQHVAPGADGVPHGACPAVAGDVGGSSGCGRHLRSAMSTTVPPPPCEKRRHAR